MTSLETTVQMATVSLNKATQALLSTKETLVKALVAANAPVVNTVAPAWVPIYELDSIYGHIVSGGNTPTLGVPFAATRYTITFNAGGHIKYINGDGITRDYDVSQAGVGRVMTDTIKQIDTLTGMTLVDLGLAFTVPAMTPTPILIDAPINVTLPAKNYLVVFGTPNIPQGNITWNDDTKIVGTQQQIAVGFGNTQMIRANYFHYSSNCKLIDLGLA